MVRAIITLFLLRLNNRHLVQPPILFFYKILILFIIFKIKDENKSIDIDLSLRSFSNGDCQLSHADKQQVQRNELHENDE